jgi:hypothetical protein
MTPYRYVKRLSSAAAAAALLFAAVPAVAQEGAGLELSAPRLVAKGAAIDVKGNGASPGDRVQYASKTDAGPGSRP